MRNRAEKQNSLGYRLLLADGSSWWITGGDSDIRWINELARIMELEECWPDGLTKLILSRIKNLDDARGFLDKNQLLQLRSWMAGQTQAPADDDVIRVWSQENAGEIECNIAVIRNVADNVKDLCEYLILWNSLQPIYQRSIWAGGLPFHAALAEFQRHGVLLAAAGGIGKSTCYRRLPEYWKPLCDDEVLVVSNGQGKYRAHPFPTWSDYLTKRSRKTWNVQYSVEIAAIFFLEQAEDDSVITIGAGEAAVLISSSATQVYGHFWKSLDINEQREIKGKVFSNACEIARCVPAFRLQVSLEGQFWTEIERCLNLSV